ncbi:MAG: DNA translocase FtsK 4TM domain-containing protein, partial [bacterium]|nr:DNA translocase FtsK 4TM domain-containing protein [bacterium]
MAEPKKKGSSRAVASAPANTKKTSSRGKSSKNNKGKDTETQTDTSFFRAEVIMICTFAVAVFLFCSNFKICGVVGNFFRQLQLGLFGGMGFLFPILLFLGICFYLSNRGDFRAILKIIGCTLCFFSLCGLFQMLFGGGRVEGQGILEYYLLSGGSGKGGGLLGGLLAVAFSALLGSLGAYLLLLVLLVIGLVFVTERSFIRFLKNGSFWVYSYARDDVSRRVEEYSVQREERKEEKRRQREEQMPVYGVDLKSTKLWELPKFEQPDASRPSQAKQKGRELPTDEASKPMDEPRLPTEGAEPTKEMGKEEGQEPKREEKKEDSEKIDFDAAERQARAARLRREKEIRRADVFVGRINLPKPQQAVQELADVDVEKLLRMQEEEKARAGLPKEEKKDWEEPKPPAPKRIVSEQREEELPSFSVPMQKGQVSFAPTQPSHYEPQPEPEGEEEEEKAASWPQGGESRQIKEETEKTEKT